MFQLKLRDVRITASGFAQHNANEIGTILGAKLAHDVGAVEVDRSPAYSKALRGLPIGGTGGDLRQHLMFAWGERLAVGGGGWKDRPPAAVLSAAHLGIDRFAHPCDDGLG